jgi:hypothetical protein
MSGNDADVTNDPTNHGSSFAGVGVDSEWDGSATYGAVTVGGYDVLRLDPVNDIPGAGDLVSIGKSAAKVVSGGGEMSDLYSVAGSVADLALNAVVYMADPLNFLITAGLSFLVDVVQPLEDLLGLVTGNGERMGSEITKWGRVGDALGPLANEIRAAADQGLIGWSGKAADAARQRLHEFADAVASLSNDVNQLKMILDLAKTVMETAQQLVISLIATFIEWLIFTWVPALAAAAPTFGASTAAAGAATTVEATTTTTRAVSFVERVINILRRLRTIVYRMHPRLMARAKAGFQLRGPDGRFVKGWVSNGHAMSTLLHDWRTWAAPGVKLVTGTANDGTAIAQGQGGGMNSAQQSDALNKDK